mmetsp:Transcript_9072/g.25813  ORF Transcript_9072/g.25813 Transcript_9072/m.25813 type:complete len:200 (+) Transcript_9072:1267-1866(+)
MGLIKNSLKAIFFPHAQNKQKEKRGGGSYFEPQPNMEVTPPKRDDAAVASSSAFPAWSASASVFSTGTSGYLMWSIAVSSKKGWHGRLFKEGGSLQTCLFLLPTNDFGLLRLSNSVSVASSSFAACSENDSLLDTELLAQALACVMHLPILLRPEMFSAAARMGANRFETFAPESSTLSECSMALLYSKKASLSCFLVL